MNLAYRRYARAAKDAPQTTNYAQSLEIVGATNLLFVSGQIPVGREGSVPASFTEQAQLVWQNVLAQLAAAKMGIDNLVKVTTFLSDRAYAEENRMVRETVLGSRQIALTVIICDIFDPAWLVEIEAIAAA